MKFWGNEKTQIKRDILSKKCHWMHTTLWSKSEVQGRRPCLPVTHMVDKDNGVTKMEDKGIKKGNLSHFSPPPSPFLLLFWAQGMAGSEKGVLALRLSRPLILPAHVTWEEEWRSRPGEESLSLRSFCGEKMIPLDHGFSFYSFGYRRSTIACKDEMETSETATRKTGSYLLTACHLLSIPS